MAALLSKVGRRSYCRGGALLLPEDCEWWAVEGRIINVNAIRNVKKKGEEEERMDSNPKNVYEDRINHLSRVAHAPGKEHVYWNFYLKVYQQARDDWERLVWDSPRKGHKPITDDNFFDAPLIKKSSKKKKGIDKKPFSMEEIQAAIRDNMKRPVESKHIEYRTASDSKWPF